MDISESNKIKSICCLGAGYVGGQQWLQLRDKCPQIKVVVLDINSEKLRRMESF